ncbi:hypothetical protein [Spiroplasma melliferum]|uniref:Spiroplasmavirus-related protein n=2 Tax=Spiroplasma melliferum TaxID=2134 RepID=A0AAI9T480_SPIME|nr:hypothetical protein [Spiroplasma melliferum]KAI93079.1 hypothetical protein SPM_003745 [Spiroplasma melliferum KC3]QCO24001.1 Spiroplasmavirus-related protein [Spiroplasma melliferum]
MINLLSESSNWDKIFSFIFDVFLFIFDVIWNTRLPMTNTTIAYFIIFFMVVKLSIYAIHGTRTQYNELGSTVQTGVSNIYSATVRGVSDTKQGMQKHIKERKQFKINRNKQQLSNLAKPAKTREQGYRRVNK